MHPIGPIERIFIWLGGYTPANLAIDSRQDREPIGKLGSTVLFATVIAALNWAVGGWTYAASLSEWPRYWAAGVTAFMGMFLVLVFDRGLVYVIDTATKVARPQLITFTVLRLVVVVAISSLTSQAVIPMLLGNELNMKALQMQEQAEQQRLTQLGQQYQLGAQETQTEHSAREVERLTLAAQTLPPDIASKLASARQCWQNHNTQWRNLVNTGMEQTEVRQRLRPQAVQCNQTEKTAKAEQTAYFEHTRTQLAQATDAKNTAQSQLQAARNTVEQRVEAAREVESANLTARSSAVLWELLLSNPAAMGKWLLITAVLLVCELLPLLYKLQMGQTPPGRRIAMENRLNQRQSESTLVQQEHAYALQEEISHASHAGMQSAMQQAEVRQVFADCFANTLKAMAPAEAVTSLMHDLQARGPDVMGFQHRHPQYATIIGQAWRNAIAQTMDILAKQMPPKNNIPV